MLLNYISTIYSWFGICLRWLIDTKIPLTEGVYIPLSAFYLGPLFVYMFNYIIHKATLDSRRRSND